MKYVYLTLGLLMALAMIAQLNDPDPWLWILLYGGCGLLCAAAAFQIYHPALPMAALLVIVIWWGSLWPAFSKWVNQGMPSIGDEMKATHPYIEEVREFLGLFLCALILIFLFLQKRFQAKKSS